MSWSSEEAIQIGRMEQKLDDITEDNRAYARRLTAVEVFMHRVKGAAALLTAAASVIAVFFLSGCAHQHIRTYYVTGEIKCDSLTTVLGQGEVSVLVESAECPDTIYESVGTGLSNNGKDALGVIAEGAARGAVGALVPNVPW